MKYAFILVVTFLSSCQSEINSEEETQQKAEQKRNLSNEFKSYWYSGLAELTSYDLEFYRYGEKREGTAMTIFVTEDFLKDSQVKASFPAESSVSVMKLNSTKKFNTGIYPYSIMQSTFLPLTREVPLLKLTSSVQEWCGQTYAQLNHREDFEIESHSYFEGEADSYLKMVPILSENEIWIQLRINPKELKLGEQQILPDFSYLQLNHKDFKGYKAQVEQTETEHIESKISYENIGRVLKIYQEKEFPFTIEKWEEIKITAEDTLVSKATKIKTMRTKYWQQSSNKYLHLRDSLSL